MTRIASSFAALAVALVLVPTTASSQDGTTYGPAKGTLVIVGGGTLKNSGIPEKFIELAGGKDANIVIIPTAGGNKTKAGDIKEYKEDVVLKAWRALGLTHVTMLHTADRKVADSAEFVKPLTEANGVWFEGGRQWNIVDSYANTLTYTELQRVLERGGVIGGTSAGASIQGDFLVRGAIQGSKVVVSPEPEHQKGFSFLRKSAIDQHINTRNRWDDLDPLIKDHPELLGIGLSEKTAIIVTGDRFEVIGAWKVAVHDNSHVYQPWEKPYYVLSVGDVYNLATRKIEKLGTGASKPAADSDDDPSPDDDPQPTRSAGRSRAASPADGPEAR